MSASIEQSKSHEEYAKNMGRGNGGGEYMHVKDI